MTKYIPLLFLLLFSGAAARVDGQSHSMNRSVDSTARVRQLQKNIDFATKELSNTYNHQSMASLFLTRGSAEMDLKRYSKALDDYTKALFFNPNLNEVYLYLGTTYERLNNYPMAIREYQRGLTFIKGYPQQAALVYDDVARMQLKLHNYKKALDADSIALKLAPQFLLAYVNRGWAERAIGRYKESFEDFKSGISVYQNDAKMLSVIVSAAGDDNRFLKNYREAINNYSMAIKLNPDNKNAYWYRGIAYNFNGDYKLADDDYSKTIAFYKNDKISLSYLYGDRARVEMGQLQFAKAIHDDSLAILLNSKSALNYLGRGDAYAQTADFKLSNDNYLKAIGLMQNDKVTQARIYNSIAGNDYALTDFKKVLDDCTSSISLDDKAWVPYVNRGRAYLKLQNKELAMNDFNKALTLDTTKKSVDYAFALFYTGSNDKAIDVIQNNVLSTNDEALMLNYYYSFACLYSLMSRADEANSYLKKCIDAGYPKKYATSDPDLENIRNTQDYKDMMGAN